jgi:hypothetical protein
MFITRNSLWPCRSDGPGASDSITPVSHAYIVEVKHEHRERPASDSLPGKPVCLLHERLTDVRPPEFVREMTLTAPPPPPATTPVSFSEDDLPLPQHLGLAEVADSHRAEGEIAIKVQGAPQMGWEGELLRMLSTACVNSELDARWFQIVPPA